MNVRWVLAGLGLVALAVAGRVMPHAANLTPLYAVALFACATFPKRWAIVVPLSAMMVSDLIIGLHATVAFTWSAMLVFALLGFAMRQRATTGRIVGSALVGSASFFIWTNLGVWMVSGMYPHTSAGLAQCYVAALPFFRNSLLANLAFTGALFAVYEYIRLRNASLYPLKIVHP